MSLDDAHDLIPDEIANQIPPLYSTEKEDDPTVWLKWFTPDAGWTFYITEYSPEEGHCFGLVDGFERELGYISVDEVKEVRGGLGLPVERDIHWTPKPLSECQ